MDEIEKKRLDQFKSLIEEFADPVDGVIYHYTSAEGLRGIIENSEIWLTNIAFVNDTTECKVLEEKKDLFNDGDLTNKFVKNMWRGFLEYSYHRSYINASYILSFSRGEPSLEQFRSYGNFRIGFDAKKLKSRYSNLYSCVYSKEKIKDWILEKQKAKEWKSDILDDYLKDMAASHLIMAASRKYKNEYFKEENEVRLIALSHHNWDPYINSPSMFEKDPPIHYRDHPVFKMPIPYVKFFIPQDNTQPIESNETKQQMKKRKLDEEKTKKKSLLPITEILIGPTLHKKEEKIACEILANDKGYEKIKVNVSNIPHRGF